MLGRYQAAVVRIRTAFRRKYRSNPFAKGRNGRRRVTAGSVLSCPIVAGGGECLAEFQHWASLNALRGVGLSVRLRAVLRQSLFNPGSVCNEKNRCDKPRPTIGPFGG